MKNKRIMNPSAKDFGISKATTDKEYRSAKRQYKTMRDLAKIAEAKRDSDSFSTDMGTCWMCWMDLTGKGLTDWRKEPFSELKTHNKICPICGYHHWRGRIWYPFRFNRKWIGNPSSRYGIKNGK